MFMQDMLLAVIVILVITAALMVFWIHRSIASSIERMQVAADNIKELEYKVSSLISLSISLALL